MQGTRGASLTGRQATALPGGRRRLGILLAVAGAVAVTDQVTKAMALSALDGGRVVPVVDGVLRLRLVHNPGAAFGIGSSLTVVLALIVIAVIAVILTMSRRLTSVPWAIALGGMLGGAVGNLVDRMLRDPGPLRGHVVDFLELPNWPVFNVADASVVAGALLIGALSLRGVTYDGQRPRSEAGEKE